MKSDRATVARGGDRMKATDKQITFLKDLICRRMPENMEWYNKPINENDNLAAQKRDFTRRDWFGGCLRINHYAAEAAGLGAVEIEALYRKALAAIEQDIDTYTMEQASSVIENLKKFDLSFVDGIVDQKLKRR
jgi:hypothetical protein